MSKKYRASLALIMVTAACGVVDPAPVPTGGPFNISGDSIEISAPGQGRILLDIADTAESPAISTASFLSGSIERSGGVVERRVLVIDASAPGVGYVKLANDANADSVKVVATPVAFKSIAVGNGHGCGLAGDGRAWCWGSNDRQQVGAVTTPPCNGSGCQYGGLSVAKLPLPVTGNRSYATIAVAGKTCAGGFVTTACGASCAITAQGETFCWGLGIGLTPVRFGPDRSMSSISVVVNPADYFDMSAPVPCGLTTAGEAYCLTKTGSTRLATSMTFTAFGAAPSHSCGLSNGDVYCWGSNSSGALGIGSTDTQTHPDPVKASATVSFKALHVGTNRTCALTTAGELYCWGGGVVAPTPMAGGGSYENFAMAPSTMDVCAVTAAGSVDCWAGVTGSIRAVTSPVGLTQIGVGSPGVGFEHSYYPIFSCGISSSGDAYCWSENFVATKLGAQ